jgi:prefoldin subunit 5
MPLPLILGAAAVIAAGVGVKKGFDAKENFDKAERIGRRAKRNHEEAIESLEEERERTNQSFQDLGRLKVSVFSDQIKYLVNEIKKRKKAKSELSGFEQIIEELNLPQMEKMVLGSLDIEKGLASGAASGALMGLGAYGSVGMLASASTGTAIASLSGAAATNATLAWLGGGSLAAGGFGMAGGMVVLGGLVAGPAIAITGFVMASKAEEALTKARDYESEVDQAIEKINSMGMVLKGLQANAKEMSMTLTKLAKYFNECKFGVESNEHGSFERLLMCGRTLKDVLDTPIMEKNGGGIKNLGAKLESIVTTSSSGLLKYGD